MLFENPKILINHFLKTQRECKTAKATLRQICEPRAIPKLN
uniref:Uncharacterized protein n=1 Tax=Vibrio vulnificus TaxID=672 RepID=A0A6S4Q7X0_VIBVL|nr:hypothetical protein [Vibrio vulnificus]